MGWFSFSNTPKDQVGSKSVAAETAGAGDIQTSERLENSQMAPGKAKPAINSPHQVASTNMSTAEPQPTKASGRWFSFKSLAFNRKKTVKDKPALSTVEDDNRHEKGSEAIQRPGVLDRASESSKRAKQMALMVRSLIVGSTSAEPRMTAPVAKPQLHKIKSQLLEPRKANNLITQLRQLPARDEPVGGVSKGPIHAVCLAHSDAEEEALHFSKVDSGDDSSGLFAVPDVLSAPVDKLTEMYKQMHIIDLIKSPDLGLGQPATANGLLAGAVPSAEAIIKGFEQITPELLALGFATGRVIAPDHAGLHPPTDRMSVLTYWWGLELLLPPPSLVYLNNAQSITGSVMNFLSALALVNNGVREILPFIRYISQFIDFEFNAIKSQNRGNGVICAATWIMPAAMVPRPWDFPMPGTSVAGEQGGSPDVTTASGALPIISIVDAIIEAPTPTKTATTTTPPK